MEDGDFHANPGRYRIFPDLSGDPIIWTESPVSSLCDFLIAAGPAERSYFFAKKINNLTNSDGLPTLFIDPVDPFNPRGKTKSELFNQIEVYDGPRGAEIQEFIRKLVGSGALVKDEFNVFKCATCDHITIGRGDYCTGCGANRKKVKRRSLYHLSQPLARLFHQPGKVIEGVVCRYIENLRLEGIDVMPNLIFKEEGVEGREIDIALKNATGKLLIIHITTAPNQQNEKSIFQLTLKHGIKTLFMTTDHNAKSIKETNDLSGGSGVIITDIAEDSGFLEKTAKIIREYFEI